MNIEQIKQKMEKEAIGRRYLAAKSRRFFMQKLYRMCSESRPKVEGTGHKGQYRKVV